MRFMCSKTDLQAAIGSCAHAVSSRSTIPLLEGILIKTEGNKIVLTGYNMETGIMASVPADIQGDASFVVEASMLGSIVRSLTGEMVSVELKDDLTAVISSGNSEFKLKTLDGDQYPKLPLDNPSESVHLPQGIFGDMIRQTIYAASTDQQRPVFNAVLVNSTPDLLEMVAIDGYRLAVRREHPQEGETFPELRYLIPAQSMREIARLMRSGDADTDAEVELFTTQNHIAFVMDNVSLVSRLVQGEFMKYEQVIPEQSLSELTVNREQLLHSVERALIMTPNQERRYPVNMVLSDPQTMTLQAHTELGQSNDEISVAHSGEKFDIDFNPRYFVEALKVIPDEMVRVSFSGSSGACLIEPIEGDAFTFLILPLRR